jgi:hypothetical protein
MKRRHGAASLAAVLFILSVADPATGQTLLNPDISVIGDFRALWRTQEAAESLGTNEFSFVPEEIELAYNGYLNPYMRADVFIGFHVSEEAIDVEEFNMTVLRGLPWSLQFNAGRYLIDFGKLNTQHSHQWGWLDTPLMIRTMLGEEGLRTDGGRLTAMLPVGDNAFGLSVSAFSSSAFGHEHGEEGHAEEEEEAAPEIMGSGRASLFSQFSDTWSAEVGGSFMGGTYDPAEQLNVTLGGIDAKLKWRPDTYRSFVWTFEAMTSDREIAEEDSVSLTIFDVKATGAFTSAYLQFRKRWDVGGYYDWTEDATVEGAETTGVGAWFAFNVVEETARFSLVYRHETSDFYTYTDDSLTLQFLWSLGPHKAHTF